jgi:hypothetical protein
MSDESTARLSLPYLAAGQMQKHVTLNIALSRLDALVQLAINSRTEVAQPLAPADGDLHILPAGRTGADWSTRPVGTLVRFEAGIWEPVAVPDGAIAAVRDAGELILHHGGAWVSLGERLGRVQGLERLGLNASADAANPFVARLNAALWTALETGSGGDGDLRLTLNKQGPSDVLSLLFQSGYGGRAELGLVGDDDLRLKVSPDGGTWHDAFSIDRTTGRTRFTRGAVRREVARFGADGSWSVPAWARSVEAICVGGGGGGAGGSFGTAGTARHGGGGGGAGGISLGQWPAENLGTTLTIDVGAGGAGGASGAAGSDGQDSRILMGSTTLLTARGGRGGTTALGAGGLGGTGLANGNAGGASSLTATAQVGGSLDRPQGGGGGGGGGGLSTANTAHAGGAGGAGGLLVVVANGGNGGSGATGTAGEAPPQPILHWAGGGGGGGGASASATGHAGGAGAASGGGGGGGAGLTAGGTGGAGGTGLIHLIAVG